jgi:Mlc titration factor MtfA (ptsG expression regulator)
VFGLLKAWKRRRLAKRPFPPHWLQYIKKYVRFFDNLPQEQHERFLDLLKVFVWEKHFIGAGGMEITDEVKVVIAAAAVRLVLGLDLSYYNRLSEIVVYPSHYKHPNQTGMVLGEAQAWGTVVLSWDAVKSGLANDQDGRETAAHEFAHVLDRSDGAFDGTPELHSWASYKPWAEIMSHHFLALKKRGRRQRKVLSSYGATNEAEFFAVATESFFEKPEQLHKQMPDLYELLKTFYAYDPLADRKLER